MIVARRRQPSRLQTTCALALAAVVSGGCGSRDPESSTAPGRPTTPVGADAAAAAARDPAPRVPPRLAPLPAELREAARLGRQGQTAAAIAMAEQYLVQHPNDGLAEFVIGLAHHEADNHGPAVDRFRRALELLPDYYLAHLYLGDALYLLGEIPGARLAYVAYARVQPDEPLAQYSIGLVDLEEAQLDAAESRFLAAIELFERMRTSNPRLYESRPVTRANCHARLADVHFARDEYEAARDELLTATRLAPGNVSAFHALSLVYRRLGEDALADEALARYERGRQAVIGQPRGTGG